MDGEVLPCMLSMSMFISVSMWMWMSDVDVNVDRTGMLSMDMGCE